MMNNCDKCIYNDSGSMKGHPCGLTEYPDVDMQGNCADFVEKDTMNTYEVNVKVTYSAVVTVESIGYGHAVKEAMHRLLDAVEISFNDDVVDDVSFPFYDVQDVNCISVVDDNGKYGVYEVYTWDDVTYTKIASYEREQDAIDECNRLNEERRKQNYDPDPICYCVKSDIQYYNLMH